MTGDWEVPDFADVELAAPPAPARTTRSGGTTR